METILRLLAENPESLGEIVKTYITKYKEPVYDVMKELMIIAKDYSENTEYRKSRNVPIWNGYKCW